MAILKSCCCWSTVRKGSYASAVYATVYYLGCAIIMGMSIHDDWEYYWGDDKADRTTIKPKNTSFLEPTGISHFTMICILVVFALSICGLFTSILLCVGLFLEMSTLLVPWMFIIMITSIIDISHSFHWLTQPRPDFSPIAATLFTFEIFTLLLNMYALLCVYSQYQEYKAGRGTAAYDDLLETRRREETVSSRCSQQHTTATSYLTGTTSQSTRESTTFVLDNFKIRKVQFPNEEESVIDISPTRSRTSSSAVAAGERIRDARITDLEEEEDDNYTIGRDYLWTVANDERSLFCDRFTPQEHGTNVSRLKKYAPTNEEMFRTANKTSKTK